VFCAEGSMLADAIEGLGALDAAQEDAGLPTVLANGSAPGESGVSILSVRFAGGMHFTAMPQRHCVWFQMPQLRIERRMAGRALRP
jgi:AraC family transcriptional regulator